MQRKYFIYLHPKDRYDLYIFTDALRAVSNHFIIDFEEEETLLAFLKAIEDGLYPHWIIVDLYDHSQVSAFIGNLRQITGMPLLPVLVVWDSAEAWPGHQNTEVFLRPENRAGWEMLVQKIIT